MSNENAADSRRSSLTSGSAKYHVMLIVAFSVAVIASTAGAFGIAWQLGALVLAAWAFGLAWACSQCLKESSDDSKPNVEDTREAKQTPKPKE